jgi:hypothetical protein
MDEGLDLLKAALEELESAVLYDPRKHVEAEFP